MTEMRRVRAGRRTVEVSNPDKVLFPDDGITKADLVEYYLQVADVMLPHVRDRPVSMKRYPNGIDGQVFYQKNAPDFFPDGDPTGHSSIIRLPVRHADTLTRNAER